MTSGWINLNKPAGISSAFILNKLKRLLPRGTKIGHAGTLDVEAEGVLPVAIGEATKLVRFLMDASKEYFFTIQFGAETTTLDREGEIIAQTNNKVSEEECHEVVAQFLGQITQIPPIYSALKIAGKPAYALARAGKEVSLAPRQIIIHDLCCVNYNTSLQQASYITTCSKGTYIRTLASDIAKSLQNLGFVIELRRLRVGKFDIKKAVSAEDITLENLSAILEVPETILDDILVLDITPEEATKVRYGQVIELQAQDGLVWLRFDHKLLAIGEVNNGRFVSSRVFNL